MNDLERIVAAEQALTLYEEYMEYEGLDEVESEDRRFDFMDAAVELLEKLAGRKVDINYE